MYLLLFSTSVMTKLKTNIIVNHFHLVVLSCSSITYQLSYFINAQSCSYFYPKNLHHEMISIKILFFPYEQMVSFYFYENLAFVHAFLVVRVRARGRNWEMGI